MGENTRQNCTRQNKKKNPGRQQPCWGFLFCTNLTQPTGALDSKSSRLLLEKFLYMNRELQATILMVTHDSFSASYASRVVFIKDGKLFHEIHRGDSSKKEFFGQIIDVLTLLGGDVSDAL